MHQRFATFCVASVLTCSLAFAADADPRKPAAIQTQDVPVVSAEVVAKLSQYQNTRTAAFRGWAPDGNGMLISTRFGNAAQLHLVTQPGGRREQLTFFDEPVSGRFIPGVSDGALLLSVDSGGNENAQLWRRDRRNFQTQLLSDGKSRNLVQAWKRDGSAVVVANNRRNGKDMDLYRVDPRKPDSYELLMEVNGQSWEADDWSADGKWLVLRRYVSINESHAALFNIEKKERTDLPLPTEGKVAIGQLAFAPDGRTVYLTTDAGSEFLRLARLDLATQKWTWVSDGLDWDVDELTVHRETGTVAFLINDDGMSRLFLWNPATGQRRSEFRVPLSVISGLEFSPSGTSLGFTLSRPEAPAEAYSLRFSDGELTRWTFSEVGGLDPASFVAPTRIQFKSFDERPIPAYLYKPRAAGSGDPRRSPLPFDIATESDRTRPSCGTSVRYVSSSDSTFSRAITFEEVSLGSSAIGCNTPSIRSCIARPDSCGTRCTSLAPASRAFAKIASTTAVTCCGCDGSCPFNRC